MTQLDPIRLKEWFDCVDDNHSVQGPRLPFSKRELFNLQCRQTTAQMMLVLAILGWILPVLPGTPFFLVAWSLGWRPPGSRHALPVE